MKTITFSAEDEIIDGLYRLARTKNMTINDLIYEWLEEYLSEQVATKS